MEYIANTPRDQEEMLSAIGAGSLEELLEGIPEQLRVRGLDLGAGLSEMELLAHLRARGAKNNHADRSACFLGGGVYDHYVPPLVDQLACRSEFITAYTPYQGEASQGTLQTIYEYQTMICLLTGMDVSNASMYDGASAAAEAVVLALRARPGGEVFVAGTLHPEYLETIRTYTANLEVKIVTVPHRGGVLDEDFLGKHLTEKSACLVYQNPNFLGVLEDPCGALDTARSRGVLSVACVNPLSLGLIRSPAEAGADIAAGDGQPLGNALAYGGPHLGFFAVKSALLRRLPGRIAGLTRDRRGERAFVLTLQAREQHIRRQKATSNICTNHALCALKALIYLAALGPKGFRRVGELNVRMSHRAFDRLKALKKVAPFSEAPFFNEFTLKIDKDPEALAAACAREGLIGPLHLGRFRKEWVRHYLVAVTEQRTDEEIDRLAQAVQKA